MPAFSFLEEQFPPEISWGSAGGPEFKTFVFESHSGIEQRNINWNKPRARYNVSHAIKDNADMETIRNFFYIMQGRATGFRYKDWTDYTMTDNQIGIGDSTDAGATGTAAFKINKRYVVGSNVYLRRIFKIVASTYTVKVDAVVQTEGGGNDYTIDINTGTVTFNAGSIPTTGQVITITCEFDIPVRFNVDHMNASADTSLIQSWPTIELIELILDDP